VDFAVAGAAAARYPPVPTETAVVVTAHNEGESLGATLAAVREAFPGARVVVADDASADATAHVALQAGAELVRSPRRLGKGGTATLAVERLLEDGPPAIVLLCDGDLGGSARLLPALGQAVERGEGDVAVAVFSRRVGGGFGLALSAARRAIRDLTGHEPRAPLSGQRALRRETLDAVLPFAPGFGMETGMTIDALRAGFRLVEVELDLEHRATHRTLSGFAHRARQLRDIARVYVSRR
jgi:glycosyltransferase involved in cell wall biosynthesis